MEAGSTCPQVCNLFLITRLQSSWAKINFLSVYIETHSLFSVLKISGAEISYQYLIFISYSKLHKIISAPATHSFVKFL